MILGTKKDSNVSCGKYTGETKARKFKESLKLKVADLLYFTCLYTVSILHVTRNMKVGHRQECNVDAQHFLRPGCSSKITRLLCRQTSTSSEDTHLDSYGSRSKIVLIQDELRRPFSLYPLCCMWWQHSRLLNEVKSRAREWKKSARIKYIVQVFR